MPSSKVSSRAKEKDLLLSTISSEMGLVYTYEVLMYKLVKVGEALIFDVFQ